MAHKAGMVNQIQFAKLIGVAESSVRYAVKKGKLTSERVGKQRLIDPEIGKKEWDENIDKIASENGKKRKTKSTVSEPKKKKDIIASFKGMTSMDAERKDKYYKAALSEQKYLEQSGKLVDVQKVKREAFECGRKTRDAMLNLPTRFAHEFAGITDPHELEARWVKEIAEVFEHLISEESK